MYPVLEVGGVGLSAYWVMALLGIAAVGGYLFFAVRTGRAGGLDGRHVANLFCLMVVGGVVGGRLFFALLRLPEALALWDIPSLGFRGLVGRLFGGQVFYGGLLLGLAGLVLYMRACKIPYGVGFACVVPCAPLFHAFGRVGCWLGGCCYGVEVGWGPAYAGGVPRFPVQLAEAAICLVLFFVLAALAPREKWQGRLVFLYLGAYALARFGLEFLRGDAARGVWLLSTSQWVSLCILAALTAIWLARRRKSKAENQTKTRV